MNLQNSYENFYLSENDRSASDLLEEASNLSRGIFNYVVDIKNRFLSEKNWDELNVLELGAGRAGVGLQLAKLGAKVTMVDFSPTALSQAQNIFSLSGMHGEFVLGDVTHPDFSLPEKYDLIVDSHLLHCLTQDPERSSYYQLIRDHLMSGGLFVAETMVHRKKIFIPDGFMFDEKNVLWQWLGGWLPVRKILDSLDLETELKNAFFDIIYFYYYGQFAFVPHKSFMDLPSDILPASVRFVVKNSRN